MYIPTLDSFFSGGGFADIGFMKAGVEVQSSLEIDETCCDSLEHNLSQWNSNHKVIRADIRNRTVLGHSQSDAVLLTYPCTKYSAIADIHGTRTGEDLFLHSFRHIVLRQPDMYVVENVPGMRKFPVVMEAMSKLPNYYMNIFCPLDASLWLPQKRARLILIGTKRPFTISPPENSRRVTLKEIIEPCPDMHIPDYVMKRLNGGYRDRPIISDPDNGDLAPTCVAHYSKDQGTRMVVDKSHPNGVRPYSVREYARLQGIPDSYKFICSDRDAFKMIGNGVAVDMAEWIGQQMVRYFNT